MSSSGLDWNPILCAWLKNRHPTEISVFQPLFEESFVSAYNWAVHNLTFMVRILQCNAIQQVRWIKIIILRKLGNMNTWVFFSSMKMNFFLQIVVILQGLISWHVHEAQSKESHHIEEIEEVDLLQPKEVVIPNHK